MRGQQALTKAFTLAEVLITLAIIGVVAAISIPSVISNAQQQEFKTGLRKAVSVLNSAITMNIALDGETPYDNGDLFRYLQRHMSVMKSTEYSPWGFTFKTPNGTSLFMMDSNATDNTNSMFYTTDGMRFEFYHHYNTTLIQNGAHLHESNISPNAATTIVAERLSANDKLRCGSFGLASNPNNTTAPPCKILVDVNGDRKPFPANVNAALRGQNIFQIPSPNSKKVKDVFTILITEDRAVPYGVVAQRAMYQAQK